MIHKNYNKPMKPIRNRAECNFLLSGNVSISIYQVFRNGTFGEISF